MDEAILKFHEDHEVEYIMQVVVDGEVVVKYTDSQSFDGVSGYAVSADEAMQQYIIDDVNSRAEYAAEAAAEAQMEQERGN